MWDIYFWRQSYIVFTGILFSISIGYMLSFPAVLTPAITGNSTDINTTSDHASWITASCGLGGFIGAFVVSPVLPLFGRKAAHIAVNLCQLIGWVIFPFATNIEALYTARIIQGFTTGGIYINSIIVSEYVHPNRRGYFLTMKKVAIAVGSLFCHAMQPFWNWRQISLFAIALPSMAIFLTLFWPESPSYLALNGRYEECEKSFKWLSGDSEESRKHLKSLIEAQKGKSQSLKKRSSLLQMVKTVVTKDFRKPMLMVLVLTLTLDLCGRYYFVAYVVQILTKLLNDKTSVLYFTLGADLLTVIALALSTLVIRYYNRRTLLFTCGAFTVLLMLTVSLLVYLDTIFKFSIEVLWLTALIIIFLCFVVNIGVVPVSFAFIGEIIPLEHRGLGSFVSGLVFSSFFALTLKLTPVLISLVGLYGTYGIYGSSLGLCLIFLYKTLPETKDKTLQEIEDNMRGVKGTELSLVTERNTLIYEGQEEGNSNGSVNERHGRCERHSKNCYCSFNK